MIYAQPAMSLGAAIFGRLAANYAALHTTSACSSGAAAHPSGLVHSPLYGRPRYARRAPPARLRAKRRRPAACRPIIVARPLLTPTAVVCAGSCGQQKAILMQVPRRNTVKNTSTPRLILSDDALGSKNKRTYRRPSALFWSGLPALRRALARHDKVVAVSRLLESSLADPDDSLTRPVAGTIQSLARAEMLNPSAASVG